MLAKLWNKLPFTGSPKPFVVVLRLSGVIAADRRSAQGLNLENAGKALKRAFDHADAKAVVVAINSPGGSPAQSRMLHDRLRMLAEEKKKPLIAYIEDVGASGGYMLALAGDEIFADPFAIVGSIGVISAGFGLVDAIDRIGVERRVYTAGENKSQLDPFRPENADDVARLNDLLTKSHALFTEMVKRRRGGRLHGDYADLFSGNFWIAEDAKARGLIDKVGDMRALLRDRFGNNLEVRQVEIDKKTLIAKLLGARSAPLVDAGDFLSAVSDKSLWARFGK